LISWWPGEGNAEDIAGTNNGSLINGASFGPGEVGQAFSFNGDDQYVQIADSPSLRPGSVSLECWFNAKTTDGYGNLISKPVGAGSSDSYTIWIEGGTLWGSVGDSNSQPQIGYVLNPVPGVWYYAAFTFDTNTQTQTLYLNGAGVATNQTSNFQIGYDTHPVLLGTEFDFGLPALPFDGEIDEASIYSRALTSEEVAAIYAASFTGKCPLGPGVIIQPQSQSANVGGSVTFNVTASGTPPLSYQWSDNGNNIVSATNAALTLTNLQPNNFGAYAVTVSNEVSAVTSSNAQLTVYGAPVIYTQPQNATVLSPATASLTVNAWGLPAPTFQWLVNGVGVPGGIGPVLTITNTVPSDGGSYSVLVSNSLGSIVSSNAVLLVNYLMETSQGQSQELATTNLTAPSSVQPSNTFTVSSVDSASLQGGELQLGGGNITSTRPGPFEGEDSFSYVLTPASGPPIQAGVTVLVNASLILGATMNASQVTIQFAGVPGTTYAIEASTDLVNWTVVGTAQAGPNGLFQFPDVNTGQYPQRYYRTVMF
jgi:hypothetical protein